MSRKFNENGRNFSLKLQTNKRLQYELQHTSNEITFRTYSTTTPTIKTRCLPTLIYLTILDLGWLSVFVLVFLVLRERVNLSTRLDIIGTLREYSAKVENASAYSARSLPRY